MLRILDARTGEPLPAAPARRGLTRVEAYAAGLDPTALRVLVTADVLVRALELGGTPVWATLTAPDHLAELRTAATTLGIRPFEDGHDLASGLGEAQAVHVRAAGVGEGVDEGAATGAAEGAGGGAASARVGGSVLAVAPVDWEEGPVDPASAAPPRPAADAPRGPRPDPAAAAGPEPAPAAPLDGLLADPAALRLALLSVPRTSPVRLDGDALRQARETLARWRRAVAGWAREPSRPVPDEVRGRLRDAWEDDLDLPAVLAVLRDVETGSGLPDGARFETYAYADRLVALDLLSGLGNPE